MADNEKTLLVYAKRGDLDAFEKLTTQHHKRVYNIALRMMGNAEDAKDIAQEVFLRVFKSIGKFREQSSFSTWIYRITANVCVDELRKRKKTGYLSLNNNIKNEDGEMERQLEDESLSPETIAENNELKTLIRDSIKKLSEQHRIVIILRDIHQMSYEEISNILNCPPGTVKSRINRAREALKDMLKQHTELSGNLPV